MLRLRLQAHNDKELEKGSSPDEHCEAKHSFPQCIRVRLAFENVLHSVARRKLLLSLQALVDIGFQVPDRPF